MQAVITIFPRFRRASTGWPSIPWDRTTNDLYIPVYYPSGNTSSTKKLIHLSPSANLENINLVQIPALHSISLHVHVVNRDGSSAIAAHVIASDPLTPTQAISAIGNENGNADIKLLQGREFHLIASTSGNREPTCAGPVKLIAMPKRTCNLALSPSTKLGVNAGPYRKAISPHMSVSTGGSRANGTLNIG